MLRTGVPIIGAIAVSCSAAFASLTNESELNGQSSNNSVASAQLLDAALFTPNGNSSVFGMLPTATIAGHGGANDVDFYRFSAGVGIGYFDVDGAGFDSYLALFDASGTLLADSDDSFPADPGSVSDLDAFLGTYTFAAAGTYFLAISRSGNFANATFTGSSFSQLTRPDGAFGGFGFVGSTLGDSSFLASGAQLGSDYTLHLSVVPAPSALALLLAAGAQARRRRRN